MRREISEFKRDYYLSLFRVFVITCIYILTTLFCFNPKVNADTVIFAYSPQGELKASIEKNKQTLEKVLKGKAVFISIKADRDGSFVVEEQGYTLGRYDDLFYALTKALDGTKREDKIWLFFAGHSDDKDIFLFGLNKGYTLEELHQWMKIMDRNFFVLGFDVCGIGRLDTLRKFSDVARYIVGTSMDEMEYGFQGIYENLDKLIQKPSNLPVKMGAYYQLFANDIISKNLIGFQLSGFTCVDINVYDSVDNILNKSVVCLDQNNKGAKK